MLFDVSKLSHVMSAAMSDRLELCLFRHGRTEWNAQGMYQGHADVDLDELGRRQAVKVGDRIAKMNPAAIYSSDLRRCVDTAAGIDGPFAIQTDQRFARTRCRQLVG